MSSYNQQEKPWKRKLKRAVLIIFGLAVVIGLLALAGSANKKAKANIATLNVPEYKVWYLPGGPERFPDEFENAMEQKEDTKIKIENFVWSSILITNSGNEGGSDIAVDIDTAAPIGHIIFTAPGYSNDTSVSIDKEDNTKATVESQSLGTNETIRIFIAFNSDTVAKALSEQSVDLWTERYKSLLEQITVDSTEVDTETVYYGNAIKDLS